MASPPTVATNAISSEKDLTCTVCLDHLKEPKVLPCCHTFCKRCLERIIEKSKEKTKLVCPQCRIEHGVPENGPVGFLTDFTITHKLESLQLRESKQPASCEQCDSTDPAVAYCSDCPASLCDFCLQAHKRMKSYRDHKVESVDSLDSRPLNNSPDVSHCSQHPDEELKAFCKTCQCLACCSCVVAAHQGHKLGLVDSKTHTQMETQLKSLVDEAQKKLEKLEENLQYIEEVEKEVLSRPTELKSVINNTFDSLVASFQSRRAELLKEADNTCNEDLKEVWAQKEYIEMTVTGLRSALNFAQRSLQCKNYRELLTLTAQTIARLKTLREVEWDPSNTEAIVRTSLRFIQEAPTCDLKQIGKITKFVSWSSAYLFKVEALPETIPLGTKVEFRISIRGSRKPKKQTTDLDIQVLYGHSRKGVLIPQTMRDKDGSWVATFTPICGGHHTIQLDKLDVQSKNIYVTGIPEVGARVRRGPDWQFYDHDKNPGTVVKYNSSNQSLHVRWNNGSTYSCYRWGTYYDIELEA